MYPGVLFFHSKGETPDQQPNQNRDRTDKQAEGQQTSAGLRCCTRVRLFTYPPLYGDNNLYAQLVDEGVLEPFLFSGILDIVVIVHFAQSARTYLLNPNGDRDVTTARLLEYRTHRPG